VRELQIYNLVQRILIFLLHFYARQQVLLIAYISYRNSVRLSGVSRPGTESSPGEIETPGFHDMVA